MDTTGSGTARAGASIGGRYQLLARLGKGGFGEVWRAKDQSLDIDVAVKQVQFPLNASPAQHAQQSERALREARHAAKLRDHPNVVAVHDVVDDNGPWIVMQLVEGPTLAKRIDDEGPLSEADAVYLAASLLEALRAAQAVKVVHRDIKPANVMLTEAGDVLLTDFGIAVHDADPSITASGIILGSAEYMAPERARGREATYASDLFSLGVTLYHAVEGISPFHRDTHTGSLTAVLLDAPPEPQRAGVLKPLLGALLQKEPAQRPELPDAVTMVQTAAEKLGPTDTTRAYTRPFQAFQAPQSPRSPQSSKSSQSSKSPKSSQAGGAKDVAGLLAKALRKSAAAAILQAEDRIQTVRHNRQSRANHQIRQGGQGPQGQTKQSKQSGKTGQQNQSTFTITNPQNKTTAKPRSPWQSKATLILMLTLLGLAAYALKHAEIPTAWHPVIADQDARVAAQNRIDPTTGAYSPGWWVCAPTGLVVLATATLWSMAGVNAVPDAAGSTVKVIVGLFTFAAGAGAAFAAMAAGAGIFHTWLPPIGALWASAATLTGLLTIAIGWTVEAETKKAAAAKAAAKAKP